MNMYDWKYILKRVIVFFIIFLFLSFARSCTVKAETLSVNLGGFSTSGYSTRYTYFPNTGSYTYYVSVYDATQYTTMANDGYNNLLITACTNSRRGYDLYAFTNGKATSSYGSISDENFLTIMTNKPCSFSLGSTVYQGYTVYVYFYMNRSDLYTTDTANYYMNRFTFTMYNHAFADFGIMGQSASISTDYPLILSQAIDEMKQQQIIDQNQTIINQNSQTNSLIQGQTTQQHNDSVAEQNAINSNTGAINDLNDDITDDNVSGAESSVDSLLNNSSFTDTSGVNAIISLPLNFIQSLTSKSCHSLLLNIPYMNEVVTIPCMQNYIHTNSPTIYLIIKTLVNGFIIYRVLLDIFGLVKSARNPDEDRIEVLDL